MKRDELLKNYYIFEFLTIFSFFLLPPMMIDKIEGSIPAITFSPFICIKILVFGIIFFFLSRIGQPYTDGNKTYGKKVFIQLAYFLLALLLIFALNFAFGKLKIQPQKEIKSFGFTFSDGGLKQFLLSTQIILMACFEEILYRKYCVTRLSIFLSNQFVAIILSALIFALAHHYAGFAGIAYSFLCALIFSGLLTKTQNLIFPCMTHSIYNLVVFFFFCYN